MTSKIKILRSSTPGARPTGKTEGEQYWNEADKQIGVVDAAGMAHDLLTIRHFSATANYAIGDMVVIAGDIQRAKVAITAGTFNAAQWENLDTLKDLNDTDLSFPAHDNDALVWNATTLKWTHGAATPHLDDWSATKRYFTGALIHANGRLWTATKTSTGVQPDIVNGNAFLFMQDAAGKNVGPVIPVGVGTAMGSTPAVTPTAGSYYINYVSDTQFEVWGVVGGAWALTNNNARGVWRSPALPNANALPAAPNGSLLWIYDQQGPSGVVRPTAGQNSWKPVLLGDYLVSLADVDATGLSDGDTLRYDAGTGVWETHPISPTLTSTRVAFGAANNVMTSDANLTYDAANKRLGVNVTAATNTLDVDGTVRIRPMTAGSMLFAGTNGVVSQDAANLSYNDTTDTLNAFNLTVPGRASFTGTGALKLPAGIQTARPSAAVAGDMRFNTTASSFECFDGTTWKTFGGEADAVLPFSATKTYALKDLVAYDGKIYTCTTAITVGAAWDATKWKEIGATYTLPTATAAALGGIKATVTSVGTFVTGIDASGDLVTARAPVTAFSAALTFSKDELVAYQGKIYRANAITAAGAWDAANFTEVGAGYTLPAATATDLGGVKANVGTAGQYVTGIAADGSLTYATPPDISGIMPFDATKTYPTIGTLVSNTGKIYRSTVAITMAAAWNPAQWADIAATVATGVEAFDAGKTYALNNIVSTGGKIYRANGPIAAAAFNATQWTEISVNAFTAGSIPFADTGGALTEDNAALNFNKTRKQLGIGVVPTATDPLLTVNSDAKINGVTVGKGAGAVANNVAFGYLALSNNTLGDTNVAIGTRALFQNLDGFSNCALGMNALYSNLAGTRNVAMGQGALFANNGNSNVAVGQASLSKNVNGNACVAIGPGTLFENTSGSNNCAIGGDAGKSITTGSGNVILGSAPGEAAMNNTVIIADGAGGEKCRFLANGNLGIGTATPQFATEIVTGYNNGLHIKDTTGSTYGGLFVENGNLNFVARSNSSFTIGTNDIQRLKIENTGELSMGPTAPKDASALFRMTSTTQGFLPPKMSIAQAKAIASPTAGLTVYCTDAQALAFFNGSSWQKVTSTAL